MIVSVLIAGVSSAEPVKSQTKRHVLFTGLLLILLGISPVPYFIHLLWFDSLLIIPLSLFFFFNPWVFPLVMLGTVRITRRVQVTSKGIQFNHLFRKRFVSWDELSAISIEPYANKALAIWLVAPRHERFYVIYTDNYRNSNSIGRTILQHAEESSQSIWIQPDSHSLLNVIPHTNRHSMPQKGLTTYTVSPDSIDIVLSLIGVVMGLSSLVMLWSLIHPQPGDSFFYNALLFLFGIFCGVHGMDTLGKRLKVSLEGIEVLFFGHVRRFIAWDKINKMDIVYFKTYMLSLESGGKRLSYFMPYNRPEESVKVIVEAAQRANPSLEIVSSDSLLKRRVGIFCYSPEIEER